MSSIVGTLWLIVALSLVPVVWQSVYSLIRFRLGEHRAGLLCDTTRAEATVTGTTVQESGKTVGDLTVPLVELPPESSLSRAIQSLEQIHVESPMLTLDQQAAAVFPVAMPTYEPTLTSAPSGMARAVEKAPPSLSPFGPSLLPSVASSRWTSAPPQPYDGPPVHPDQRIPFSFGDQMPLRIRSLGSGPVP